MAPSNTGNEHVNGNAINWPEVEMWVRVFFTGKQRMERAEGLQLHIEWTRQDPPITMMSDALQQLAKWADRMDDVDPVLLYHVGGGFLAASLADQDRAWAQVKVIASRCETMLGKDPFWPSVLFLEQKIGMMAMIQGGLRTDCTTDPAVYFGHLTQAEQAESLNVSAMPYIRRAAEVLLRTMRSAMKHVELLAPDSPAAQIVARRPDNSLNTFIEIVRELESESAPHGSIDDPSRLLGLVLDMMHDVATVMAEAILERSPSPSDAESPGEGDEKVAHGPHPPNHFTWEEQTIELPPRQWRLLEYLWQHRAALIEDVAHAVWENEATRDGTIRAAVSKLTIHLIALDARFSVNMKAGYVTLDVPS